MIKDLVESDARSIWMNADYIPVFDQLATLRKESKNISNVFEEFKESTLCYVNQVMGKVTSTMHREIANKNKLEEELEVVKSSNTNMKNEVIQLREMI